jgi:hypothetical protein
MRYQASPEPLWNRVAAVAVALAFLSTLARLLLQMPEATPVRRETRIQLRWLAAEGTLPAPLIVAPVPARSAAPVVAARTGPAERPVAVTAPATPTPAPVATAAIPAASWSQRLYGKDGTLAVPEASTARQKSATEQVFEHRDALASGVGERPLEGAVAKMFEDSKKPGESPYAMAARVVHGRDVQPAQARRPPPVAFNPNLHEQKADLGSEATGDAYKAAPIRFEKAPDLKGEASRRIRVAVGDLERRYPRCSAEQRTRWMAPVLAHLDALQRVEYRFNNGADPVEAEHSLPSAADSAYDMARRALWDAERRMKTCS